MRKVPDIHFRSREEAYSLLTPQAKEQQQNIHEDVGHYIAAWANAESSFVSLLQRLLDSSYRSAQIVFFSITANRGKMDLIRRLADSNLSVPDQQRVSKFVERFKSPTSLRNELVHSEYSMRPNDYSYLGVFAVNINKSGDDMITLIPFDEKRSTQLGQQRQNMFGLMRDIYTFCKELDERSSQGVGQNLSNITD